MFRLTLSQNTAPPSLPGPFLERILEVEVYLSEPFFKSFSPQSQRSYLPGSVDPQG